MYHLNSPLNKLKDGFDIIYIYIYISFVCVCISMSVCVCVCVETSSVLIT